MIDDTALSELKGLIGLLREERVTRFSGLGFSIELELPQPVALDSVTPKGPEEPELDEWGMVPLEEEKKQLLKHMREGSY